jgi:hypothetical protein
MLLRIVVSTKPVCVIFFLTDNILIHDTSADFLMITKLVQIVSIYMLSSAFFLQLASSEILSNQYEDVHTGISLSYPKTWNTPNVNDYELDCLKYQICWTFFSIPVVTVQPNGDRLGEDANILIMRTNYTFANSVKNCNCDTLKEFVKSNYRHDANLTNFQLVADNKTIVGKQYPAWHYEYKSLSLFIKPETHRIFKVFTNFNDTFYEFQFGPHFDNEPYFTKYLPDVRSILNSIKFISTDKPIPRTPSFMLNETRLNQTIG